MIDELVFGEFKGDNKSLIPDEHAGSIFVYICIKIIGTHHQHDEISKLNNLILFIFSNDINARCEDRTHQQLSFKRKLKIISKQ